MRFVWDEKKAIRNFAKHKVSFEAAMLVFQDPYAISRPDRIVDGEERWQTIGLVRGINILVVAHTYPEHHGEDVIRIISARKAAPYERRLYEEGF